MDLVAELKQIALFKDVPEAGLRAIAAVAEPVTVAAGDPVVVEGGPADALYVIRSGRCQMYTERGGDAHVVVVLGPGDPVGASAVLERSGRRRATVVAVEPSELLAFRGEKLLGVVEAQPSTAAAFYRSLAEFMFRRMRQTADGLGFARLNAADRRRPG